MSVAEEMPPIRFVSHTLVGPVSRGEYAGLSFAAQVGKLPETVSGFTGPLTGTWTFTTDSEYQIASETFTSAPFAEDAGVVTVAVKMRNAQPDTRPTGLACRIRVKHGKVWGQASTVNVVFGPELIQRWESVSKELTIANGDVVEVRLSPYSTYAYPQWLEKTAAVPFANVETRAGDTSEGHLAGFFASPGSLADIEANPIGGGGVVTGANLPGPRTVSYVLYMRGAAYENIWNELANLDRILTGGDVAVDNHGLGFTIGGYLAAPLTVEWFGKQRPVAKVSFTLTFTDPRIWSDDWTEPGFLRRLLENAQSGSISTWPAVPGPASIGGGTSLYTVTSSANMTLMTVNRQAEFHGPPAPLFVGDNAQPMTIVLSTGSVVRAKLRFRPSVRAFGGAFALDMNRGVVLRPGPEIDTESMLVTAGDWRMELGQEYKAGVTLNETDIVKMYGKWWGVRD